MKSLNRTLSLVLVLVMVLGLFGVAGAAFTDAEKIQYNEAVDVMAGIGVIEGMGDGTFAPTGTLTRAQAAKMVTYAVLGKTVAESLSGVASTFKDVTVAGGFDWAIPSIEYLKQQGIVEGRGNGIYDPNGKVTGYELGKMLLCALGYGKDGEFSGDNYELEVAILANKTDLYVGRASTASKLGDAATREEAALYCFNAIKYSPTGAATEKIYGITGWEKKTINGVDTLVPVYGWIEVPAVATGSIMAGVYPTLKPVLSAPDDLGRPSSGWTYGAKKTLIASVKAEPIATFNKAFTSGDLYKALGAAAADIALTVNSSVAQTTSEKLQAVKNDTTPYGGVGITTEIYKTSAGLEAVQIKPSFAKVDVTATKATATVGAYNTYTIGGLNGKVFTSVVDKEDDVDTAFVTGTVAKGDMVSYFQGENGLYIVAPGTIKGLLTSITSAGIVTIGNIKTAPAASFTTAAADLKINTKDEQTFYVDANGYLLGVKTAAASTESKIAMLLGADYVTELKDGKIVTTYYAKIAGLDGTVSTVPTVKGTYDNVAGSIGKTMTYTVDTKGVYTFTAATASATVVAVTALTTNNPVVAASTYANAATKFVVANYTTDANGDRVPTGTVTVYTGIGNVPTFATLAKAMALDLSTTPDGVVEVVFIGDDVSAVAVDTYVYSLGTYTITADGFVVDTIVKGQPGTITVKDKTEAAKLAKGLYSKVSIAAGEATVVAATTTVDKIGNVGGLLFLKDDTITTYGYASKSIANDVPVFTITAATGAVSVGSAADLTTPVEGTNNIYVVYNAANTAAIAVYIVK